MTATSHGQPTTAAFWQQQTAGLRQGAVRVRRKLGRVRRGLRRLSEEPPQVALFEETRSQFEHVGAEAARLRTDVDALAEHLRLLTVDVARSEWERRTGEAWIPGNPYLGNCPRRYRTAPRSRRTRRRWRVTFLSRASSRCAG